MIDDDLDAREAAARRRLASEVERERLRPVPPVRPAVEPDPHRLVEIVASGET